MIKKNEKTGEIMPEIKNIFKNLSNISMIEGFRK